MAHQRPLLFKRVGGARRLEALVGLNGFADAALLLRAPPLRLQRGFLRRAEEEPHHAAQRARLFGGERLEAARRVVHVKERVHRQLVALGDLLQKRRIHRAQHERPQKHRAVELTAVDQRHHDVVYPCVAGEDVGFAQVHRATPGQRVQRLAGFAGFHVPLEDLAIFAQAATAHVGAPTYVQYLYRQRSHLAQRLGALSDGFLLHSVTPVPLYHKSKEITRNREKML